VTGMADDVRQGVAMAAAALDSGAAREVLEKIIELTNA
jgi:anthranilate phosphoribosyltransferase